MTQTLTRTTLNRADTGLTPLERALLRLLVIGYSLEDAAHSIGLSPHAAHAALQKLQDRCGVSGLSRLLSLAILKSWV